MNCIKILILVSLIPLALRGASLLGDVVVNPSPSPDEQQSSSRNGAAAASAGVSAPLRVEQWGHRRRRTGQSGRAAVFAPRRFGGGGAGAGEDFFGDDKRFAPTGSNPLHNL